MGSQARREEEVYLNVEDHDGGENVSGHRSSEHTEPQEPGCMPKRWIFATMAFLGLANVYAMRANLSVASESMQDHYSWSNKEQGAVLSSFFWGYVCFQIPGALMAVRWGGKRVFGYGVLITAVFTLLLPACAPRLWLLCGVRAFMGLSESITYPALTWMMTIWVPAAERARMIAFIMAGAYFGNAIAFPVTGVMVDIQHDPTGVSSSWPLVFYTFGAIGVLWFIFWEWLITDSPETHPTITRQEKKFIESSPVEIRNANDVPKSESFPWKAMLTHPAALTLYINHFAYNYVVYTMMTYLPKYLDEELGMSLKDSGIVGAVPYILQCFFTAMAGQVADKLIADGHLSLRNTRILVQLACFALSGGFLILSGFLSGHKTWAVVVVSLSIGFSGMASAAFNANYLDVSPHWAGNMFGISNTIANFAGIIAPIVAGNILGDPPTEYLSPYDLVPAAPPTDHWQHVWYVCAGVYTFAAVIWVIFMRENPVPALN